MQTAEMHATNDESAPCVFFAPRDNIRQMIISLINNEQKHIKIAAYSFTDTFIGTALIQALNRGVTVELVLDGSALYNNRSIALNKIHEHIPLIVYHPSNDGLMHHKFMLFATANNGYPAMITGSYNFTYSAQQKNRENLVLINHEAVINAYAEEFEILKKASFPLLPKQKKHSLA
jgi:phosphatidylserine/phosphatidylglycerophosphate/cardiolipin synthase-like enzyme